ncbi:MAG: BACON domain-containing carbohydrate-binding protein [Acidobacteriota bacterium]
MRNIISPVLLALTFSGAAFSQNYTIQKFAGGGVPQGIQGIYASLGSVGGVATDGAGNVYIALQSYSAVVRMDATTHVLTLVAGIGTPGLSGDGGPAASAQLNKPSGMALDAAGNLYIADSGNNRVRKVSNGVITTVAGGTGSVALSNPTSVAVDSSGNLYIADSGNHVVRKLSGGITATVAGTGTPGSLGDGGTATSAQLNTPEGVAVDASGNFYIADSGNGAVRKVSNGILTTVFFQQGSAPAAVTVDGAGTLFFAANGYSVVAKIPAGGAVSVVAGTLNATGYTGDGGSATDATLDGPVDLAVDASGNLYIADFFNSVVRKVAGGIITTAAGGPYGYAGDGGTAASALLLHPTSVAAGPGGAVYIADSNHNLVRKVVNGAITTVGGTGLPGYSGDGGAATSATLNAPWGVAVDSAGNLYISDAGNSVVRKVSGGVITTVAGTGTAGFSGDNGAATSAMLSGPAGIALDTAGNLYIADYYNSRVRMVSGGTITTVAGNGTATFAGDGLGATSASLSGPLDVKLDAAGNLYIADFGNNRIRMVTAGIISTVAGNGTASFGGDNGSATSAQLNAPSGVALDAGGDLFIADASNNVIRQVTSGIITTIAGNGTASYSGDNGPAAGAGLNAPLGIATDSLGRIFVADSSNNLIRVMSPPCSFALTTSSIQAPAAGGSFNIGVQTAAYCSWSAAGLPDWVVPSGASSGTGPASITLVVAAAAGVPRSANISVAGITVTINQMATCSYAISPGGQGFTASGGIGAVTVTAPVGCAWSASNTLPFVSFNGASSGSGNGVVNFFVAANAGAGRSGTFTVAGFSFDVEEQAASVAGLNIIGSMAHLAAQENWTTTFTLVNQSAASLTSRLSFSGDAVDPSGNGPLMLPLTFPQQAAASGPLLAASFDKTIPPNASLIATTAGPQTPPVLVGSAQLAATGAVDGFAIFHQIQTEQEAVVPMETRNASSYLLAFDNTNGLVLGVAVENVSAQAAVIPVIIRDDAGAVVSAPGTTISLGGSGHTSFVLSTQYAVTADKRGTIEFDTPAGGQISVLGLRFTPPNNALTTIPALANVPTGGGSIAHLAAGDGWQTTFVLVNTGSTGTQATLSFFADSTGAPLPLPLSFPQSGTANLLLSSSVTQTLVAGATYIVVSSGAPDLLTGSAQLTTTGNVGGFVIFRHNNQEAVVPLESRDASSYVLAFDNTNGTATGVAVNDVSAGPVSIPVVVRDETGTQLKADTITLAANGHYAFTLGVDRYPETAGIRGTIQFVKPASAQIGALGIRIPTGAAHTFTTLPALAK